MLLLGLPIKPNTFFILHGKEVQIQWGSEGGIQFHGHRVLSQMVPLNSQIVPQQNFSRVFKPKAEVRALFKCISHSLS